MKRHSVSLMAAAVLIALCSRSSAGQVVTGQDGGAVVAGSVEDTGNAAAEARGWLHRPYDSIDGGLFEEAQSYLLEVAPGGPLEEDVVFTLLAVLFYQENFAEGEALLMGVRGQVLPEQGALLEELYEAWTFRSRRGRITLVQGRWLMLAGQSLVPVVPVIRAANTSPRSQKPTPTALKLKRLPQMG